MPNIYKTDIKITTSKNLGEKELNELNEKMGEILTEWAENMYDEKHSVEIGWSWYQHMNLI